MKKHTVLIKETNKFEVEVEAKDEQEARHIFEKNLELNKKAAAQSIKHHFFTEWRVLEINGVFVDSENLPDY